MGTIDAVYAAVQRTAHQFQRRHPAIQQGNDTDEPRRWQGFVVSFGCSVYTGWLLQPSPAGRLLAGVKCVFRSAANFFAGFLDGAACS